MCTHHLLGDFLIFHHIHNNIRKKCELSFATRLCPIFVRSRRLCGFNLFRFYRWPEWTGCVSELRETDDKFRCRRDSICWQLLRSTQLHHYHQRERRGKNSKFEHELEEEFQFLCISRQSPDWSDEHWNEICCLRDPAFRISFMWRPNLNIFMCPTLSNQALSWVVEMSKEFKSGLTWSEWTSICSLYAFFFAFSSWSN